MIQSRPSPVPCRTYQSKDSKDTKREENKDLGALQNTLDTVVSCRTEHSHIGESSLIWNRAVTYGIEQSHFE